MHQIKDNARQKVLIVIVDSGQDVTYAREELIRLVDTAQGIVCGTIIQKRQSINNATFVGYGKLEEIQEFVNEYEIDVVIFDSELNAIQRRNIKEQLSDCDVLDKTDLILDIFALHANSAEGKKQVELAQLQYNLATKDTRNYSRQGGGIGTRGPGETKLESNRRLIRDKIHQLKLDILELSKNRAQQQKSRRDNGIFIVALVGYTNAGKSTLFNALTDNDVLAKDMLFATLDTTTRKVTLPSGIDVLFVDTVGFIKDLPHSLISAFKSTLDITKDADLLLNVCDISSIYASEHLSICQSILEELQVTAPIKNVFNKIDCIDHTDNNSDNAIFVSGKTKKGISELISAIDDIVLSRYTTLSLKVNFTDQSTVFGLIKQYGTKYSIVYHDDHIVIELLINKNTANLFEKYTN